MEYIYNLIHSLSRNGMSAEWHQPTNSILVIVNGQPDQDGDLLKQIRETASKLQFPPTLRVSPCAIERMLLLNDVRDVMKHCQGARPGQIGECLGIKIERLVD